MGVAIWSLLLERCRIQSGIENKVDSWDERVVAEDKWLGLYSVGMSRIRGNLIPVLKNSHRTKEKVCELCREERIN